MRLVPVLAALVSCAALAPAAAQPLARRVAAAPDGVVLAAFAARPGVCGDGHGSIGTGRGMMRRERGPGAAAGDRCEPGPVRIEMIVRGGEVRSLRTRVGAAAASGREGPVTDLGLVGAPDAAAWLLALAGGDDGRVGRDALLPAVLADSASVWPALLRLARDEVRARAVREEATFWLSRLAAGRGSLPGSPEEGVADEVRAQAVFALAQRPKGESVPELIAIARTHPSPAIRDRALFWLGQSGDARALDLFERILTESRAGPMGRG